MEHVKLSIAWQWFTGYCKTIFQFCFFDLSQHPKDCGKLAMRLFCDTVRNFPVVYWACQRSAITSPRVLRFIGKGIAKILPRPIIVFLSSHDFSQILRRLGIASTYLQPPCVVESEPFIFFYMPCRKSIIRTPGFNGIPPF